MRAMETSVPSEIRERIVAAAQQLVEQTGRTPTVDAVRRLARTNMGDTSTVMKEWRRAQSTRAASPAVDVPDALRQAHLIVLAKLWTNAQDLASEALQATQATWERERQEAETLRAEMAAAFEAHTQELAIAQMHLDHCQNGAQRDARIAAAQRSGLEKALSKRETQEEYARAEALGMRHHLREVLAERDALVKAAAEGREQNTKLAGQVETLQAQNAALLARLAHQGSAAAPGSDPGPSPETLP